MADLKKLIQVGLLSLTCLLLPLAALSQTVSATQTAESSAGLTEARDLAQDAASGALGEYYRILAAHCCPGRTRS